MTIIDLSQPIGPNLGEPVSVTVERLSQCAVKGLVISVGVSPTRQLSLLPVAIEATVEVTRRLKPSMQRAV